MEPCIESIRDELEKMVMMEKLSPAQIEKAMICISDEEMLQIERPIHTQLVGECHSMIYRLNGQEMPSDCAMEESLRRVNQSIEKRSKRRSSMLFGFKVVAVLVLVSAAAIFHDSVANRTLLHGETVENGQQYRIEGRQASETFIDESSADDRIQTIHLSTKEISEVAEALGSTPEMPSWLPEGWALSHYFLSSTKEILLITATYEHPEHQEALVYGSKLYTHPDIAAATFEQDAEGGYAFWGEKRVYLTTNMGYNVAIWVDGEEVCHVGGPLPFEELRAFFDSIE